MKKAENEKSESQASLSLRLHRQELLEFSRQEYWSGLPFPLKGIFPTQGSNLSLLHCRQNLYHLSHQGRLQGEIEAILRKE